MHLPHAGYASCCCCLTTSECSDRQLVPHKAPMPPAHLLAVIQAERELSVEHAQHVQALGSIQLQQQLRLAQGRVHAQHVDRQLSLVEEVPASSRAGIVAGGRVAKEGGKAWVISSCT